VEVGIRALRDGLSRHLAEVRRGRMVTVTDHGKRRVHPARRRKRLAPDPVSAAGTVSDLVAEQRR
jgi:antitoxin (DNA-binding transcriptional repressor) of toxin-antitoxin stability system